MIMYRNKSIIHWTLTTCYNKILIFYKKLIICYNKLLICFNKLIRNFFKSGMNTYLKIDNLLNSSVIYRYRDENNLYTGEHLWKFNIMLAWCKIPTLYLHFGKSCDAWGGAQCIEYRFQHTYPIWSVINHVNQLQLWCVRLWTPLRAPVLVWVVVDYNFRLTKNKTMKKNCYTWYTRKH